MLEKILIPIGIFLLIGTIAGVLLSVFSKIFAVKTDDKAEEILQILPGLNCGVCGFSGCENYANELTKNGVPTNKCIPGGDKISKKISEILGTNSQDVIEKVAFVKCNGKVPENTSDVFIYNGEKTCMACNSYYSGKGICNYGCIGFGDCVEVCNYNAINILNNIAVVNAKNCIGCSLCVTACPKKLIQIKEATKKVSVACSSCNSSKETMQICKNGCIACKKCEKICKYNAITVTNNLASINYEKCTSCMDCVDVCPKKCILVNDIL
ncbi:MAG: RnfABCDGE type electron transport complex subunit B [Oscillospiraceae bacterium]